MSTFDAEERGIVPFTGNVQRSDDPIHSDLQSEPGNKAKSPLQGIIQFWNIFDSSPQPAPWRAHLGFFLTFIYLVGVVVIIVLYFRDFASEGRPTTVDIKYVSPDNLPFMNEYICQCELPPSIQDVDEFENRNKTRLVFNRCYNEGELRSLDVLQYGDLVPVEEILQDIDRNSIYNRRFNDQYILRWESYELSVNGTESELFTSSPLADLRSKLKGLGFVGDRDGFISLNALVDQAFFTVPQGFIRAEVTYNCTCDMCKDLWTKYSFWNESSVEDNDRGWAYCYNSSGDSCSGSCRFYPTHNEPWGIAMFNFANELQDYIPSGDRENTIFTFYPTVYYAKRSIALPGTEYNLNFLEVKRSAVEDVLGPVPECAVFDKTSVVNLCNGTSICEAARVYTPDSTTLESVELACMNDPTEETFAINQTQCQEMVDRFGMITHLDFDKGGGSKPDVNVCEAFSCKKVPAAGVYWANFLFPGGDIALSRMIEEPSLETSYIPALCFNNYKDVLLQKNEKNEIQWIHDMDCTTLGKSASQPTGSQACWPSGNIKFLNATRNDEWSKYNFSSEDIDSGKTMFACYRFSKKSYSSYMYNSFGIVAGIIGSWLLLLSCVFWIATKVFPSRSSEVASGSFPPSANGVQLTKLQG
ncbi:hypothetical protein R1flu_012816 [Riccia fluitans]|uniref:Uncharacterized protein n=1 Tax=Riccia fluitans TaxID=41844 RepID=A0ABD1ZE55_9MARC